MSPVTTPQQQLQTEPALTPFEEEFSDRADAILTSKGTGYRWREFDKFLADNISELDGGTSRCKSARGSGRAANVLVESNDMDIDLYVVFIGPNYKRQNFIKVAKRDVGRFENVKTVAIADNKGSDGKWRVRTIVEQEGVGLAAAVKHHFPAVSDDDIISVTTEFSTDTSEVQTPEVDEEDFASAAVGYEVSLDGVAGLLPSFQAFAAGAEVQVDATTAADLLAAMLSAQFVLFAGPSGTGKSTLARLLARFMAPSDRWAVVEARRQWLGPEDLFGYYSTLADYFASTTETPLLLDLHDSSVALVDEDATQRPTPPILVVEEINLSPVEGYLAPFTHGLSTVAAPYVRWPLHGRATGAHDADGSIDVPRTALLGPYPRLLGTINVDATALAPAPKVAGRACVVLLEPIPAASEAAIDELTAMAAAELATDSEDGPAAAYLGDPRTALKLADTTALAAALQTMLTKAGGGTPLSVSRRDLVRSMTYMAYYLAIAAGGELAPGANAEVVAAENAFLHFVLPTLPQERFAPVTSNLLSDDDAPLTAGTDDATKVGPTLRPRLERLKESIGSPLGLTDAIDYWSALS